MLIKEITDLLDQWAPISEAESFDNVGLLVGDYKRVCTGVLITLDTLEAVVDQAIVKNCNLIVSFHPIIFKGLKKINKTSYVERVVFKALEHGISIYAIHTSLDNMPYGVNHAICNKLDLQDQQILIQKNTANMNIGMGMYGVYPKSIDTHSFFDLVRERFNLSVIRHSNCIYDHIQKVAVLGGSGSFAIPYAIAKGCDVLITSDLKYHEFFQAESRIILMDIGHYESEQYTKNLIFDFLTEKIPNFEILLSNINTNPIQYS